jgi:hypothetical protein
VYSGRIVTDVSEESAATSFPYTLKMQAVGFALNSGNDIPEGQQSSTVRRVHKQARKQRRTGTHEKQRDERARLEGNSNLLRNKY